MSIFSVEGVGWGAPAGGDRGRASLSSDGTTCVPLGEDLDTTETLVPGVTVSPSLATNCQRRKALNFVSTARRKNQLYRRKLSEAKLRLHLTF